METLALHFAITLALFVSINWIGRHSATFGYLPLSVFAKTDQAPAFNALFRILAPTVGVVLAAAALYAAGGDKFVDKIWLVAVYYVAFRLIFNVARGRGRLLNWPSQAVLAIATIGFAYGAYVTVIREREHLLPNFDTVANELWILVLLFLYQVANSIRLPSNGTERRKRRYLVARLRATQEKYGEIFDQLFPLNLRLLGYAIYIYETFNRPRIERGLETWVLHPLGLAKTLGPMQVTTHRRISDREGVQIGVKKLGEDFVAALAKAEAEYKERIEDMPEHVRGMLNRTYDVERDALRRTTSMYNRDDTYVYEVMTILSELQKIDLSSRPPPPRGARTDGVKAPVKTE